MAQCQPCVVASTVPVNTAPSCNLCPFLPWSHCLPFIAASRKLTQAYYVPYNIVASEGDNLAAVKRAQQEQGQLNNKTKQHMGDFLCQSEDNTFCLCQWARMKLLQGQEAAQIPAATKWGAF